MCSIGTILTQRLFRRKRIKIMNKKNKEKEPVSNLLETLIETLETQSKAHLRNYNKTLKMMRQIKRQTEVCLSE
jgi:hypothetical protein